ncbi:MAG TPA: carboxymuconolactone decarboxylase family protein [Rhizomicrobium sp.]|nr:carboxymuconolactone decarboxylase family protein [Rhizomicrobium sp.]
MTSENPRLKVLADEELRGPAVEVVKAWNMNLHRTLAHSPEMLGLWLPWAEKVLRGNSLPERDREIIILRVAAAWNSDYEWGLHAALAIEIGMTEADLKAIVEGPGDSHWSEKEAVVIEATDEVLDRKPICERLWRSLEQHYSSQQLIDFMMTIAEFSLVAMMLTTLHIPLENRSGLRHLRDYR